MPKNLSTVGGATKLRFGKNCREDQAENSIVFNASEEKIDATGASGLYITPLELASIFTGVGSDDTTNTFVAYNQSTHQLFRTQVPLSISALSGAGGNRWRFDCYREPLRYRKRNIGRYKSLIFMSPTRQSRMGSSKSVRIIRI